MQLTFSMIISILLKELQFQPLLYKISDSSHSVVGYEFNEYAETEPDLIYVYTKEAPEHFPANCIMTCDHPNLASIPSDCSILFLPESLPANRLIKALSHSFHFYHQWRNQLLTLISRGSDWFTLLEHVHEITQNPMIIYSRGLKVLAYTRTDGSDDALWRDTVSSGMAKVSDASESEEFLKYVHLFETENRPFKHQGPQMSDPFYSCNILAGQERIGMVTLMEHNHPITQAELDLLALFASALSIRMQMHAENLRPEAHAPELISDLLTDSIRDHHQLSARLLMLDWHVHEHFLVLKFQKSIAYLTGTQWQLALDAWSMSGLNSICCLMQETDPMLCAIVTLSEQSVPALLISRLQQYCEVFHLSCGCSDIYSDLLQTSRGWEQASAALDLMSGTMRRYSQVRSIRLLQQIKAAPFPEDLLSPIVLTLRQLDSEEGTAYCRTLETLCRSRFRQSETAKLLGIHRTTLTYRLQKIEELTGLDWDDADQLMHAWISLAVLHH